MSSEALCRWGLRIVRLKLIWLKLYPSTPFPLQLKFYSWDVNSLTLPVCQAGDPNELTQLQKKLGKTTLNLEHIMLKGSWTRMTLALSRTEEEATVYGK